MRGNGGASDGGWGEGGGGGWGVERACILICIGWGFGGLAKKESNGIGGKTPVWPVFACDTQPNR